MTEKIINAAILPLVRRMVLAAVLVVLGSAQALAQSEALVTNTAVDTLGQQPLWVVDTLGQQQPCVVDTLWVIDQPDRFTLSNNVLYDAMLTPNIRLGISVGSKWSVGFTTGFACWPSGNFTKRKLRHLLLSPEVRMWTDSLKTGHYFGANFIYSPFNAGYTNLLIYKGVKDERRQGDLVALGLFYGYSWRLGNRWTLEAQVGAAVGYAWYDRFDLDEHGDCWLSLGDGKSAFVLPQLGLNFVYHIPLKSRNNGTR